MIAFYNEIDPYAAAWLRNLIAAGHIAPGVVDERSIVDLDPAELRRFTQCHFFAGIGVWSYALRLAGWPDDRPVWTGSCPCQPFSNAGKGEGHHDQRHLWPAWFGLISECRPTVVFGEQVASSDGLAWLDVVFTDLENADHAVAAVDLCAAGVGAPHIRQRLYFLGIRSVGHAAGPRSQGLGSTGAERPGVAGAAIERTSAACDFCGYVFDRDKLGRYGCPNCLGEGLDIRGFWSDADWLPCRDGKARPVKPGTFPLAHGAAARVGRLRAYGNAIVPQAAAAFIQAAMPEQWSAGGANGV